jgi:phage host-nuclease inhibitor protein Gam
MKKPALSAEAARMEADLLLADILIGKKRLNDLHAEAEDKVKQVQAQYAPDIDLATTYLAGREMALEKLVRKYRAQILGDGDRADLPRGSVMLKIERRVKQAKGMLARLKAAGLSHAVRVIKEAVDWDVVNKFNDDTLARLGTERSEKLRFDYELKGAGKNG